MESNTLEAEQLQMNLYHNQAGTIDGTQTIENGVLAGPITIPGTITVTGVLVIV